MNIKPIFLCAAILVTSSSYSQEKALKSITRDEAEKHMKYLSSDALEGRRTGSEGNNAAAAYISSAALKMGVSPLPGREDLFQSLEYLRVTTIPGESIISISDSTGNPFHSSQLTAIMAPGDSVSFSGEVVFAGYGYMNTEEKYNDFSGLSLKGRSVIVMTRNPDLKGNGLPSPEAGIKEMDEARKLSLAMLQQAKAVFFVGDPALGNDISSDLIPLGSSYQLKPLFRKQFSFNLNAYIITREVADLMLGKASLTLKQLQDSIALVKRPVSFVIPDLKAEVTINVARDTVTSSNIVGYIEGSDPLLKNECVIYTAHYDHVGRNSSGNIFNGANDNASGSVGLLNVARAFTSLNRKPPRSIVFLWTTGEEEGLHGSTYYVDNPLFPLDKTVADINFDMIGRSRRETDTGSSLTGEIDITGSDTIKIISGGDTPGFIDIAEDACAQAGIAIIDEGKGEHFSGSDHYPFYRKGIPALFFFTGLHKDYHRETDDFEFIDFDKLVKVSKAGFLTGYRVASEPGRPQFVKSEK
ncbi:MAG TPA: M20/M25/M40 family metallo-hydrolase [Bacteroidales bacterium]|nr:M20/M25/M40 family metallo-hydrolase [Bacteroidales bacterium]